MAKGQKRKSREAKKPKAAKKLETAGASPFTQPPPKRPAPPRPGG